MQLAFLIVGLNDLDVLSGDISKAYLNAKCREKIWFEGGIETEEDKGKVLIVTRALYGLKLSGAAWRADWAATLRDLQFTSTQADPENVWIQSGGTHYDMVLIYVDDILIFSKDLKVTMDELGKLYKLKPESVKEPNLYLGANMEKVQLPNGKVEWAMGSRTYVKNAVLVVESLIAEDDLTSELIEELGSRFLQLVGILRWTIEELGRLDIYVELSQLSQHQALTRWGHLEAINHIFAFLKTHENGARIVFDPKTPQIDERVFKSNADWRDFNGDVTEELLPNMPEPRGQPVVVSCFVDANHAGNVITRRSHTGMLIYVQNAPIIWFSKRQNTVESSSFGSEFVAHRAAKDVVVALRYKLRILGVPIDGPANVFCDNNGVVKNTTIPESMLAKKRNTINYHVICKVVAAKILRVGKEDGMTNLADLFTKVFSADRRRALSKHILY